MVQNGSFRGIFLRCSVFEMLYSRIIVWNCKKTIKKKTVHLKEWLKSVSSLKIFLKPRKVKKQLNYWPALLHNTSNIVFTSRLKMDVFFSSSVFFTAECRKTTKQNKTKKTELLMMIFMFVMQIVCISCASFRESKVFMFVFSLHSDGLVSKLLKFGFV